MKLREKIKEFVIFSKSNNCESCGEKFDCEITLKGCWCSQVKVSEKTRENLRQNYKLCLCRQCLNTIEMQISAKND